MVKPRRSIAIVAIVAGLPSACSPDPDIAIELDDRLWSIVDVAVSDHLEVSGSWFDDGSLVTNAGTPLTDVYLAENCPDQGALGGQDADG
jgi:hypothetical protein